MKVLFCSGSRTSSSAADGSPAEVHGHLVHFVEQEDGVPASGLLHHLDDLAREGADVGAAMASDLRLVPNATKRQADELAVGGPSDGLGERRLSDAGRSDEAEDGTFGLLDELADGEELDDTLLDLLEAEMVFVEHRLGAREVTALAGCPPPRHSNEPVEVVARDGGFGRHGRHSLETLQLLKSLVERVLGHLGLLDASSQFVGLVDLLVLATQFLLDRLHLLVEVVLLLRPLHLLLDAPLDAAVDLELLELGSRGWRRCA